MQPTKSGNSGIDLRRVWRRPTLTELPLGRETKATIAEPALKAAGPAEPPLPPAPATKLGFSLEWAFPLSSRLEK
jgi:hypothetical protein